jgi:hypothetical protein
MIHVERGDWFGCTVQRVYMSASNMGVRGAEGRGEGKSEHLRTACRRKALSGLIPAMASDSLAILRREQTPNLLMAVRDFQEAF